MLETKRKKGESFESFYRRFVRRIQQSKVLVEARGARFHDSPASRNKQKKDALEREKMKKEKDYLRKIGKLEERSRYTPRRGRKN